jgi:hypothetical protein
LRLFLLQVQEGLLHQMVQENQSPQFHPAYLEPQASLEIPVDLNICTRIVNYFQNILRNQCCHGDTRLFWFCIATYLGSLQLQERLDLQVFLVIQNFLENPADLVDQADR